jgi:hypothetical protein
LLCKLNIEESLSDKRLEKLHNEEHHNFYSSPSIIRMIKDEMGRACSTNENKNAYRIVKRPLGISRRRWMDKIKMDLGETVWGGGG